MEELLKQLLLDLSKIGETHKEINDSDVEEAMSNAIFEGFLRVSRGYTLPQSFGMYTEEGNTAIRKALDRFIAAAVPLADENGLDFHKRLQAFQSTTCTVGTARLGYNDFFRYRRPSWYDALGNVIK